MIPTVITHQDKLLSIDTNAVPFINDALAPGIKAQPLFLDAQNGIWVLRVKFPPGITLPSHFHTGTVHLWTMSGCWYYTEYPDQKQTAGHYLYEPGGSIHQFNTPADNTEDTDTFMIVTGCNVNFDADGNFMGIMDAGWIESMINELSEQQGHGPAKYIKATGAGHSVE